MQELSICGDFGADILARVGKVWEQSNVTYLDGRLSIVSLV